MKLVLIRSASDTRQYTAARANNHNFRLSSRSLASRKFFHGFSGRTFVTPKGQTPDKRNRGKIRFDSEESSSEVNVNFILVLSMTDSSVSSVSNRVNRLVEIKFTSRCNVTFDKFCMSDRCRKHGEFNESKHCFRFALLLRRVEVECEVLVF